MLYCEKRSLIGTGSPHPKLFGKYEINGAFERHCPSSKRPHWLLTVVHEHKYDFIGI